MAGLLRSRASQVLQAFRARRLITWAAFEHKLLPCTHASLSYYSTESEFKPTEKEGLNTSKEQASGEKNVPKVKKYFHHQSADSNDRPTSTDTSYGSLSPKEKAIKQLEFEKFKKEVATVKSVGDILAIGNVYVIIKDPVKISVILERLRQICIEEDSSMSPQDIHEILQSDQFTAIGSVLHERATSLPVHVLLNSLRSLLPISEVDLYIIESLERQVLWLLKKMSVNQLYQIVEMHQHHKETDIRKDVYTKALALLEKRWIEITNPKDLVSLMYAMADNPNFFGKLEDKALDLAEHMHSKELYRILYILARQNQRNTPLVRSLAYHLNKQDLHLSILHLSNLLYACAKLTYYENELMENITNAILNRSQQLVSNRAIIPSILQSISILRWCNTELLDALSETLVSDLNEVTSYDLTSLLLTCAHLNYMPESLQGNISTVIGRLQELRTTEPKVWMDVVWSAAVFQRCDEQMLDSVINDEFQQILKAKGLESSLPVLLKLLNIDGAARHDLCDYTSALLPSDYKDAHSVQLPIRSDRGLQASVLEALVKMAPPEKYLRLDISFPCGYLAEIEVLVNSKGDLQPLTDYKPVFPNLNGGAKEVPENFHRIAFKLLDFHDLTRSTIHPIGLNAMAVRHMTHHGYKVIVIPHTEFSEQRKIVQKVQYIQNKINTAIGIDQEQTTTA